MIPILSEIEATKTNKVDVDPKQNEFQNEEAIWRVKSTEKNYALKRPPALQDFYLSLNKDERRDFRANCRLMLHSICRKLRAETKTALNTMEATQLFNGEANAHRAQNLYLNKLYQSISCDALEDKVLSAMKSHQHYSQRLEKGSFRQLPSLSKASVPIQVTNNEAVTMERKVSSPILSRKPRLPTFDDFLSSGVNVAVTKRSRDLPHTLFRSIQSNRNLNREDVQIKANRSLSDLRATPAGKALQKRTSRVVLKILREQETGVQSNGKRIGACLQDDTGSRHQGRGYYSGFLHLFDDGLSTDLESKPSEAIEGNAEEKSGEEVRGPPMKGQLVEDSEPAKRAPSSKQLEARRRSIFRMSIKQSNDVRDNQARLVLVWEVLRVSTVARLSFMQKYSSSIYATHFAVAVDLWNAVALMVIMRLTVGSEIHSQ